MHLLVRSRLPLPISGRWWSGRNKAGVPHMTPLIMRKRAFGLERLAESRLVSDPGDENLDPATLVDVRGSDSFGRGFDSRHLHLMGEDFPRPFHFWQINPSNIPPRENSTRSGDRLPGRAFPGCCIHPCIQGCPGHDLLEQVRGDST